MIVEPNTIAVALTPVEQKSVRAILHQHAPKHSAFVFGSRVVTSAEDLRRVKRHSDLDIALSDPPLQLPQMDALRDAFSQSDLPMRVDIARAADLPDEWKKQIWPL